jgi:outer membrane protein OmpA-like peptidoglycan-associated protein
MGTTLRPGRRGWLMFFLLVLSSTRLVLAQAGLKGEYYNGTNFERKVHTRTDPAPQFRWFGRAPAPGVNQTYYSVRWTGKLLAPVTGKYVFSAEIDDGLRLWVGNRRVIDAWQLNDNARVTGSIVLQAGQYYDLRVDFFNAMLEGEIILYWQYPNPAQPCQLTPRMAIRDRYFFQTSPLPPPTLDVVTVRTKRPVPPDPAPGTTPSPAATRRTTPPKPGPVLPKATAVPEEVPTPVPPVVPEPFVPRPIPFEQGSYALSAEARAELDRLADALRQHPDWRLEAEGQTDLPGDPRQNQTLAEYRAQVVATYLVRRGIAAGRITFRGRGGRQAAGDTTAVAEAERAARRRVLLTIRE